MADLMPDMLPPGVERAGLIGIAVAALYKFWRYFKADRREDAANEASDRFRGDLQAMLSKCNSDLDRVASERNAAVQRIGRLEAENEFLKREIDDMKRKASS